MFTSKAQAPRRPCTTRLRPLHRGALRKASSNNAGTGLRHLRLSPLEDSQDSRPCFSFQQRMSVVCGIGRPRPVPPFSATPSPPASALGLGIWTANPTTQGGGAINTRHPAPGGEKRSKGTMKKDFVYYSINFCIVSGNSQTN